MHVPDKRVKLSFRTGPENACARRGGKVYCGFHADAAGRCRLRESSDPRKRGDFGCDRLAEITLEIGREQFMKIGEFSRRAGLSAHTLRYYEKIGLLRVERNAGGHRSYSSRDVKWVRCIKRLRGSGMPLSDVREFASLRHRCGGPECRRLEVLKKHRDRLAELHEEILQHLAMMDEEIDTYKKWNDLE